MKPRIKLIQGIWFCGVLGHWEIPVGCGYSPTGAWYDWKRQQ